MLLPYLELPVVIGYAPEHSHLPQDKVVIGKFQPVKISSYHEGFHDVGIFIYIDGQPTQIALSLADYEVKIQAYWNKLAEQQNVKQKLGLRKIN